MTPTKLISHIPDIILHFSDIIFILFLCVLVYYLYYVPT